MWELNEEKKEVHPWEGTTSLYTPSAHPFSTYQPAYLATSSKHKSQLPDGLSLLADQITIHAIQTIPCSRYA